MNSTNRLHETVAAVCPITGVSVPTQGVSATVTVHHAPSATQPQRDAAAAAVAAFDWSQATHDAWLEEWDGANLLAPPRFVRLTADRTSNVTALADVTGLSFRLKTNTHYVFKFTGAYTAAAGTTGLRLAVNGPASPVVVRLLGCVAESATATRQGAAGAYDTALVGANSGGATALPFWIEGNITTGAANGVLALRFGSEVGGSLVTIFAGSWGELKAVG